MSRGARLAFRPLGLLAGVTGGLLAGAVFRRLWRRLGDGSPAPSPTDRRAGRTEVVLAATVQGAVFAAVKALVDRLAAEGFAKVTGAWPGDG